MIMSEFAQERRRTILAAFIGAVGGGLLVAFGTKAIPKLASQMMQNMMQEMMSNMREMDCSPEEM